jgi:hypothetical protein
MACKKCGNCCRYNIFEPWQFKNDLRWLEVRGGRMSGKYGLVPSVCPQLKGNDCGIEDNKPIFCMDWPGTYEECEPRLDWLEAIGCKFFEEEKDAIQREEATIG